MAEVIPIGERTSNLSNLIDIFIRNWYHFGDACPEVFTCDKEDVGLCVLAKCFEICPHYRVNRDEEKIDSEMYVTQNL